MGPHRGLGLPRQSIALRNIAEEYDSSSSMNLGRVRKTMSLEETRVSCSKGYVKSPVGPARARQKAGNLHAVCLGLDLYVGRRREAERFPQEVQKEVH